MLAAGVSLLVAVAYVHFRDVPIIWSVLLQALFWLSPVVYHVGSQPLWELIHLNPLARCLTLLRFYLVYGFAPPLRFVALTLLACACVLGLGLVLFLREQDRVRGAVIEVHAVLKAFSIPHQARRTLFHRLFGGGYSYESFLALRDVSLQVGPGEFVAGLVGAQRLRQVDPAADRRGHLPAERRRRTASTEPRHRSWTWASASRARWRCATTSSSTACCSGSRAAACARSSRRSCSGPSVERFVDARLDALSTGLRLRLAYTLAVRADAPVLLLDEALTVGDETFRQRCVAELRALRARGRTALLAGPATRSCCRRCATAWSCSSRAHGRRRARADARAVPVAGVIRAPQGLQAGLRAQALTPCSPSC